MAGSRRIDYAGSVHGEREVQAVVEVLRGGATALRLGRNVRAMEARVAALFGKQRGVMCNSGSSALYLAVEVLDLDPGDGIVTSALTFSTDVAPMVRKGIVPAFLKVVEDSCDALGLTLRGTPTGTRADISLTSFALSHIITAAGTGGMVCFDDDGLADRALLLRRW